jgi:RNA polymerase sigma-70 factor (ECF subfamily)
MMSEEDNEIVRACLAGAGERFGELIARHQGAVAGYLYRLVPNTADREDICQDVFVKAFLNLGQFRFEARFSTWLFTIAYRRAIEVLRKRQLATTSIDDLQGGRVPQAAHDLEHEYGAAETRRIVQAQIARLSVEEQTILSLYHYQDLGLAEISQIVGKPEGTLKSDLFRIRKKLKQGLQRQLAGQAPENQLTRTSS